MTHEWACVPETGISNILPASTFDVEAHPPTTAARLAHSAPPAPWARRRPNSATGAWAARADARRLRRDERLEIHAAQKSRLEQLALQDGTRDAHNGFHGKNHRAFAHRVHVKRQPHLA